LWQVEDEHSATVAEHLYRAMLTEENKLDVQRAAQGLHLATKKIRDILRCQGKSKIVDDLMTWILFIHTRV